MVVYLQIENMSVAFIPPTSDHAECISLYAEQVLVAEVSTSFWQGWVASQHASISLADLPERCRDHEGFLL